MLKRKIANRFAIVMGAVLFLALSPAGAQEHIRTLGKDTLGESVKEFKKRYPKAVCGKATSPDIEPRTLIDSNGPDIDCCLNDRESLAGVSPFQVLNLDNCAFHAVFWKGKLCDLLFYLDVRSIGVVLPFFERLYKKPAEVLGDALELGSVTWMEDDTTLSINLISVGGEGTPWLTAISVSLWKKVIS